MGTCREPGTGTGWGGRTVSFGTGRAGTDTVALVRPRVLLWHGRIAESLAPALPFMCSRQANPAKGLSVRRVVGYHESRTVT
jgi:hypothetical protein